MKTAPLVPFLAAIVFVVVASCSQSGAQSSPDATTAPPPQETAHPAFTAMEDLVVWTEFDRLVEEGKLRAAEEEAQRLLDAARDKKDSGLWAAALIRRAQAGLALSGFETVARALREADRPENPLHRTTIDLFYGHALLSYSQAYSWEIQQRERMGSRAEVGIDKWTRDQIRAEALDAYLDGWQVRQGLGALALDRLGNFLEPNNYPAGVRDTLRDSLSYFFVDLLSDSSLWSARQSSGVYRLDLAGLLAGDPSQVTDQAAHPLERMAGVLADLEHWHRDQGDEEAALNAALERYRRLHGALITAEDRLRIRQQAEQLLAGKEELPWWSSGMAALANMLRAEEGADRLAAARDAAAAGAAAHPDSVGGAACRQLVQFLEGSDFSLAAMQTDAANRRSIEITHRNLKKLYFHAYPVDLERQLHSSQQRQLFPQGDELRQLLTTKAALEWSLDLPATPDLRHHRTFLTPPGLGDGAWTIVASDGAGFRNGRDTIAYAELILGNTVLLTQSAGYGAIEATVIAGDSGEPLEGIALRLFEIPWGKRAQVIARAQTDGEGRARFEINPRSIRGQHLLVAERDGELALTHELPWGWQRQATESASTLLYTDRSIYRPGQTLHFKALLFAHDADSGLKPQAGENLTIILRDPNGEEVATSTLVTNSYGTAGGEMTIPAGRPLGSWSLLSSRSGHAAVQVEEYKRPSFEVELHDPESPLRLNRPAVLHGEASYLFGLPVTTGRVSWRVERLPAYLPWWMWFRPTGLPTHAETIATGEANLDAEGRFELPFTPQADERLKSQIGLVYTYQVQAEVTDEAGETRWATRSFRIGLAAIEATIETDSGFLTAGQSSTLTVTRRGLNGESAAGEGSWQLFALRQPPHTALPADQPLPPPQEDEERFATPGDRLRPRWDYGRTPEAIVRSWATAEQVAAGRLSHGDGATAALELPPLNPGAYRLRYQTEDPFGEAVEALADLLVAPDDEETLDLAVPVLLRVEESEVEVGGVVRLLASSGFEDAPTWLEIYRQGQLRERRRLKRNGVLEIAVGEKDRGGFAARLTTIRDHQWMSTSITVKVPWRRQLDLELATFRNRLRPGRHERWRLVVRGQDEKGRSSVIEAAEVLAYMYDRSLDQLAPHVSPSLPAMFPRFATLPGFGANLGRAAVNLLSQPRHQGGGEPSPLRPDRLTFLDRTGIGGPGRGGRFLARAGYLDSDAASLEVSLEEVPNKRMLQSVAMEAKAASPSRETAPGEAPVELRSDFAETALWQPHLITGADGSAAIEFTVPDSVTSWSVWFHALTRDLRSGTLHEEVKSVKELLVRPYLPRFLRQGDQADLKVSIDNTGTKVLSGTLRLEISDPLDESNLVAAFGLTADDDGATSRPFTVEPGSSTTVAFPLKAPRRLGSVNFKVTARAGGNSDGELRALPLLPARFHLVESRFAALTGGESRQLAFERMDDDDPTRQIEQLVVTIDAQLFQGVLAALPYLIDTPYEHTEAMVNRYAATAVLSGLFERYPQVAALAADLAQRDTQLESWRPDDPNRKIALEETPWLVPSRGGLRDGEQPGDGSDNIALLRVLNPAVARAERATALRRLQAAQLPSGAFPWFSGGPPSNYMTIYVLHGLARALEFGADVPKPTVVKAWRYLAETFRALDASGLDSTTEHPVVLTFMLYVASAYPDDSWLGDSLPEAMRQDWLDRAFAGWRTMPPYLKALLALTLHRAERGHEAQLVLDSILDSSRTDPDLGTYWAPEARAWLWYNDIIEGHAFVLTALNEISPEDPRRHGLVQWLFLNKKLNHWSSTRSTAEVIEALARYLESEGTLGAEEEVKVEVAERTTTLRFPADRFTGKSNQIVVRGNQIDPRRHGEVRIENHGPNRIFASATWHLSTETLPASGASDLFAVERRYFKRVKSGEEIVLEPLAAGTALALGDEIEVQLTISSKHAAEFVHLRDPRPAGFEPSQARSGWRWDLGLVRYEEIRDSGTNFFIEWLPAGDYTLRYRIRAATAGSFRAAPTVLQSLYAPEFAAYSAGTTITIDD